MIYACFKIYYLLEVQYTWIGFVLFLVADVDEEHFKFPSR